MIRILFAPLIVALSALAPLYQFREPRWRNFAGWLDPAMDVHWARLKAGMWSGDFDHDARNVLAEWCRLDPQRAGKFFSLLLCLSLIGNAIAICR